MSTSAIGIFHPLIVHFPIVLFFLALVCAFINFFIKHHTIFFDLYVKKLMFHLIHIFVIFATIMMIPSIITGLAAAHQFPTHNSSITIHKYSAFFAFAVSIFHSGFHLHLIKVRHESTDITIRNQWLVLLIFNAFLVFFAADYGGLIVHGTTPFQTGIHKEEKTLYYRDPVGVDKYPLEKFEAYLHKQISINDVLPIFRRANCAKCHADQFVDGYPLNFSIGDKPAMIWLPRNEKGELVDWQHSQFYQTVILKNTMPKDADGRSIGLPITDRVTLLKWLQNGATYKENTSITVQDESDEGDEK